MNPRDDFHCVLCADAGVPVTRLLPLNAFDRDRVAALCKHIMTVHRGGPINAWEQARLVYPLAAMAWEDEIYKEAHSQP